MKQIAIRLAVLAVPCGKTFAADVRVWSAEAAAAK